MASSVPYDPYIPQQQSNLGGPSKTQAVQNEIDGTVNLMRDNMHQMAERGGQLNSLQSKTDDLEGAARQFNHKASDVRKRMWLKDMKMRMCLIIGVIILIIVIVVPIAVHFK